MTEKVLIRIQVDGKELELIDMGEGHEDSVYKDDVVFFKMGHALNKERTLASYDYTFTLTRHRTKEELERSKR